MRSTTGTNREVIGLEKLTVIPLTTEQEYLAVSQIRHISGTVVPFLIEGRLCLLWLSEISRPQLFNIEDHYEVNGMTQSTYPRNLLGDLMHNLPCVPSDSFISMPGESFPTEPLDRRSQKITGSIYLKMRKRSLTLILVSPVVTSPVSSLAPYRFCSGWPITASQKSTVGWSTRPPIHRKNFSPLK